MAYPQEVKNYAIALFLTVGSNGDHKYAKTDIAKEIPKKFRDLEKYPDESTIRTWINTKDKITGKSAVDKWEKGQRAGYKEAEEEIEQKLDEEEKIDLHVDSVMRDRANRAIKLCEIPDQKLGNKEELSNQELKQIQLSEVIFNNLNLEAMEEDQKGRWDDLVDALKETRKEED